jgi:hypothetical protein
MSRLFFLSALILAGAATLTSAFHAGPGLSLARTLVVPRAAMTCSGMRMLGVSPSSLCVRSQRTSSFVPTVATGGGTGGRGGVGVWSNGGGGGGDDGEEEVDPEVAALLKQYNLKVSDLPPGALALGADKLSRFLGAYANGLNKWLINSWPAWRDKMLADPEFAYKLMVEETVGLGRIC